MSLAPGTRLGPYEILGRLGAGGMGEVYCARDSKLDRQVAVKVLAERLVQDPEARERFEREAKAVAALSHPNILAIYDFGRLGDVCYTVMELLEGRTLRTCLQPGPLPPREAIGYALQIAQGLAAAHDKGIVHRDLKPENVFVNQDDRIKILDFGLVRHTRPPRSSSSFPTDPGRIMGTANYMSPEQVRGLPADPRSDLFCFALLLYEMLWGEHPFSRPTSAETMTAILREQPPRFAEAALPFPASLGRLLRRCLEKSPRERFQTARDLAVALAAIEWEMTSSTGHPALETPETPSIAVLPFRNLSSSQETEYFSDGMTEEILNVLTRIPDLRVAARSSSFAFKGKDEDVRKVGRQLNVHSVLEGSVRQAGDRIRVIVQLVDVAGGYQLWSERYDRKIGDVFAVQDDIACAIAETLKVRLLAVAGQPLVRVGTRDLEAYDRYLKGLYSFHQRVLGPAIEQFRTAVAKDPGLIAAHTGLAHAYCLAGFYGGIPTLAAYAAAKEAALHAESLEPGFAEVHLVLGLIEHFFGWNLERGERELRRAIELRPRFSDAHSYLAQMLALSGRFEEGIASGRLAVDLDPYSPLAHVMYSYSLTWARRFDAAVRAGEEAVRLRPDAVFPYLALSLAHLSGGRFENAVTVCEKAVELTHRSHGYTNSQLGTAYAYAGRTREALRVLEELRERSQREYVPPYCFARIYAALGDLDAAFAAFEQAIEQRNTLLWALDCYDEFAHLRADPRFPALVERVRAMTA